MTGLPRVPQPLSPMGLMAMRRNQVSARPQEPSYSDYEIPSFVSSQPAATQSAQVSQTPIKMQSSQQIQSSPAQQTNFTPSNVVITQKFGNPNAALYGRSRSGAANINRGLDVAKKPGEPQLAPGEGNWVVESAYAGNDFNTGWGRSVVMRNTQTGEKIRRSHLDKVYVKPGDVVTGKQIGTTGRTGRTTGYHADIEYITPQGKLSDYSRSKYFKYEGKI